MAKQFVDDVGLGRVHGVGVVANVLSRVESFKSKSVQEFTLGEQSTNRLQSPAGFVLQELGDVFELGDLVLAEVNVLLELFDSPVKLLASTVLEHFHQFRVHKLPHTLLIGSVLESRNGVTHAIVERHFGDEFATLAVLGVFEAWMVRLLDTVTFRKDSLPEIVKV